MPDSPLPTIIRREQVGVSDIIFGARDIDSFAPVVAEVAGNEDDATSS